MHNSTITTSSHHHRLLIFTFFRHGHALLLLFLEIKRWVGVMFLHNATTSIAFFLLLLHLSCFPLVKLFSFLFDKAVSLGDVELFDACHDHECKPEAGEILETEKDLVADVLGGESLLFLRRESGYGETLLCDEVRDDSKERLVFFFEEEDKNATSSGAFVEESPYYSPQKDLAHDKKLGVVEGSHDDVPETDVSESYDPRDLDLEDATKEVDETIEEDVIPNVEEKKDSSEDEKFLSIKSEKLRLDNVPEDHETYWSTSMSSVEWRSSETEYPFSSSSRRSSSRWESYTVFPKYNEGMVFLDRISAQKLSETESLRSIKVQPRLISERIVHKLSTKPAKKSSEGRRDPYQELESAYVAQICLAWEALNWNYTNFREKNSSKEKEGTGCPDYVAQQFQEFQVLLQRFIENEPYENGRRPEVYARRRIWSPKLLQVPEFRDSVEDQGKGDVSVKISSEEFLELLEESIRTFMNFLKADKETCSDIIRSFIRKKASSVDLVFIRFLKKANKRKKTKLKVIGRQHRCTRKRKLEKEEEMEILMGLIDLKVVSRVLRMADMSPEQLHWCEEMMSRVRVWDGRMKRDSSPLFFPVH